MSDLKKQLIRLGSTNPELRPHIREVLSATEKKAMKFGAQTLGGTLANMNGKIANNLEGKNLVANGRVISMKYNSKVSSEFLANFAIPLCF